MLRAAGQAARGEMQAGRRRSKAKPVDDLKIEDDRQQKPGGASAGVGRARSAITRQNTSLGEKLLSINAVRDGKTIIEGNHNRWSIHRPANPKYGIAPVGVRGLG